MRILAKKFSKILYIISQKIKFDTFWDQNHTGLSVKEVENSLFIMGAFWAKKRLYQIWHLFWDQNHNWLLVKKVGTLLDIIGAMYAKKWFLGGRWWALSQKNEGGYANLLYHFAHRKRFFNKTANPL